MSTRRRPAKDHSDSERTKRVAPSVRPSVLAEVASLVTGQLVAAVDAGVGVWEAPWHSNAGAWHPVNALTGRAYRGLNWVGFSLAACHGGYTSNQWATYKQWQRLGRQVARAQQATKGVVWVQATSASADAEPDRGRDPGAPVRRFPKAFSVFNADQLTEDLAAAWQPSRGRPSPANEPDLDRFIGRTGATIVHDPNGTRAAYNFVTDVIHLPAVACFDASGDYYSTALHELTHWTGHRSRLDRHLVSYDTDPISYADEELVAELGSAMLCHHFGITPSPRADHARYVGHWIARLRAEPTRLWSTAKDAQAACDLIVGLGTLDATDACRR